jgi:hypothetical protein
MNSFPDPIRHPLLTSPCERRPEVFSHNSRSWLSHTAWVGRRGLQVNGQPSPLGRGLCFRLRRPRCPAKRCGACSASPRKRSRGGATLRLWWRSVCVKRPQAALAVLSLLVGAAVTSMLLNLYEGLRHKMTQEFRAYGPNVVVAPSSSTSSTQPRPLLPSPTGEGNQRRLLPSPTEAVKKNEGLCHPERG